MRHAGNLAADGPSFPLGFPHSAVVVPRARGKGSGAWFSFRPDEHGFSSLFLSLANISQAV